jgi:hypothetical protein
MSKYRFEVLHPYTIISKWDELLPHIERVIKVSNDEFTAESIKYRAVSGNGMIIAVYEDGQIIAVTTAETQVYDSGLKSLLIPIFAGDDMFLWGEEFLELVKKIAIQFECNELRGFSVRSGWMKVLKDYGWRENHTVITMPLTGEDNVK